MDPWCFELPLDFKPANNNMIVDLNNSLQVSNFIVSYLWNLEALKNVFDDICNFNTLTQRTVNVENDNRWVWLPSNKYSKLVPSIYSFLINNNILDYT